MFKLKISLFLGDAAAAAAPTPVKIIGFLTVAADAAEEVPILFGFFYLRLLNLTSVHGRRWILGGED